MPFMGKGALISYLSFLYGITAPLMTDLLMDSYQEFFNLEYSKTIRLAGLHTRNIEEEPIWVIRYLYCFIGTLFTHTLIISSPIFSHFAIEEFKTPYFLWKPSPVWILYYAFIFPMAPFLMSEAVVASSVYDTFIRASFHFPICLILFILLEQSGSHRNMRIWYIQNEMLDD